mgnify:FL=1
MKNVVLWGFAFRDARNVLGSLNKDLINIKKWIVNEDESRESFFEDYDIEFASGWHNKGYFTTGECAEKYVTDYIYDNLPMLLQNFARDEFAYRLPHYEYINIINMLVNHYYAMLKQGIDMVVFEDIPHGGSGLTMYFVAKVMGIQTLMLVPAYEAGYFTYCYSIEDYGIFADASDYCEELDDIVIKKEYKKNVAYMTTDIISKSLGRHSLLYYLKPILEPRQYFEKKKILWEEQKEKYSDILEFLDKKIIKSIGKYFQINSYNKYNKRTVKSMDLSQKYIYFPLHFQPEMNTDVLGKKYVDQLLAIEKLHNMIPNDWYIYVKENPKQKSYMRGRYFFERLSLIPNVVFVDRSVDTYKLMESAQFVSTITGTAAWEAITGGKNALIFGKTWFDHFPGIFRFEEVESIQEILQYRISHDDIQKETNKLRRKFIKGYYKQDTLTYGGIKPQENNDLALLKFFKYIFTK